MNLSILSKVVAYLPLLRTLILVAEDTGQSGEEKLNAVLEAATDALTEAGVINPLEKEVLQKVLTLFVTGIVKVWNKLGWPDLTVRKE